MNIYSDPCYELIAILAGIAIFFQVSEFQKNLHT